MLSVRKTEMVVAVTPADSEHVVRPRAAFQVMVSLSVVIYDMTGDGHGALQASIRR